MKDHIGQHKACAHIEGTEQLRYGLNSNKSQSHQNKEQTLNTYTACLHSFVHSAVTLSSQQGYKSILNFTTIVQWDKPNTYTDIQVSWHREQVTHIKSLRDAMIPHNRPLGMYAHHSNRESPLHNNNSEKTFMIAATKIGCKQLLIKPSG